MPPEPLDFPYVQLFLRNVGVHVASEPGQYCVMRRAGPATDFIQGPAQERRGFDDLREAFIYGLRLALRPDFYRPKYKAKPPRGGHNARAYKIREQQIEARRHEIEAERAAAANRREAMIRAELAKLGGSS